MFLVILTILTDRDLPCTHGTLINTQIDENPVLMTWNAQGQLHFSIMSNSVEKYNMEEQQYSVIMFSNDMMHTAYCILTFQSGTMNLQHRQ